MKNCRACKADEFCCDCDEPSYYSDGFILGVTFVAIAILAAIGLAL